MRADQVTVDYNVVAHARKQYPGIGFTDADIDAGWQARTATNPRLYNGRKFRLAASTVNQPSSDGISLRVGLASYKEMLGTHHAEGSNALVKAAAEKLLEKDGDVTNQFDYTDSTMGIGVFPITADGHVVLIKRSGWTGEAPNKIDRPGGHPEPDMAVEVRKQKLPLQ